MTEKVLVLLRNLDSQKDLIKSSADFLSQWSNQLTQGAFSWSFEFQKTSINFDIISGVGIQGTSNSHVPIKYLDPKQIVAAASGQCDTVALLYNSLDYPDAISVHTPIIVNGLRCIQIPISPQANKDGIATNLSHELLHEDYFVANQGGANLTDDVHQHSDPFDPRPQANFSHILLNLKPYWPLITRASTAPNLADEISRLQAIVVQLQAKLAALAGHKSKIQNWAQAIKDFEGWYPGSRSFRNNNPGNIKYAGQKGTIGADNENHAMFRTYQDGLNALITQLTIAANGKSRVYSPDMTLLQFFTKYAEKNQQQYATSVANKLQVTISTPIKQLL